MTRTTSAHPGLLRRALARPGPLGVALAALLALGLAVAGGWTLWPRAADAAVRVPPPLTPVVVLRGFVAPAGPYAPGHRGVDLGGTVGEPVVSSLAGTVAFAGLVAGTPVVSVDGADGRHLTYEPVVPAVARGDPVVPGAVLGRLAPGPLQDLHPRCERPCLHWGLDVGGAYRDPLALLGDGRVRLLPWSGEPADAGRIP